MNLYISDLHFGHANVIKFDQRPFTDVDEMDRCMIELWNARVSSDDDVFIVGDFCHRAGKTPDWYLRQLKGHKHLIVGNHDKVTIDCENAAKYIESVDKMLYVPDGDKHICLCHFPIADWNKARHGSWHIYGHIHSDVGDVYQFMQERERALNAAACINNYTPASFNELVRNNDSFREKNAENGTIFVAENTYTGEKFRIGGNQLLKFYNLRPARIVDRNLPLKEVDAYSLENEDPITLNRTNMVAESGDLSSGCYDNHGRFPGLTQDELDGIIRNVIKNIEDE